MCILPPNARFLQDPNIHAAAAAGSTTSIIVVMILFPGQPAMVIHVCVCNPKTITAVANQIPAQKVLLLPTVLLPIVYQVSHKPIYQVIGTPPPRTYVALCVRGKQYDYHPSHDDLSTVGVVKRPRTNE